MQKFLLAYEYKHNFPKYRLLEINFNWEVLCKNTDFCYGDVCDFVMCLLWSYICSDFTLFNVLKGKLA